VSDFIDDPRLTAYALGELDGAERADVEALLSRDEDARRAVDEIRVTAALVTAELKGDAPAALTAGQRAAIAARSSKAKPVLRMRPVYWIATAASVAAVVAGIAAFRGTSERDVAAAPTPSFECEANVRINEDTKQRLADEAQLKQLQDSIGQLNEANEQARHDLDRLADAQRGGDGGIHASGGGGQRKGSELLSATKGFSVIAARELKGGDFGSVIHGKAGRSGAGGRGGGGLGAGAPPRPGEPRPPANDPSAPQKPGAADADTVRRLESLGYVADVPSGLDRNATRGFDTGLTTASYSAIEDNPFRLVKDAPLSTFGIDVDTASYSNVRRLLNAGQLPPPGAVRIEEMVNYFPYDYAPPQDGRPFSVRIDVAGCPWKTDHRLVRVGIKGKALAATARPAANLVFLLDVSGSMSPDNRLPLILESMKMLVGQLEAKDHVAIVVYAGESGLALPSTSCEDKAKILAALDSLHAGGSTNGAAGIQLAYEVASQNRIDGGINRVILATDGDFNVGVTDQSSLVKLVQEKAKSGTFLSVLGVGDDNYKDSTMEMLADRGNGNYAYIDTLKEGEKVLVQQASGTLVTIAKDVKVQVEFNPAQVGSYRLIGYEDRLLAPEDFKDDRKDAGEIGAGHTVTALYEVVPPGALTETAGVDPLKYQPAPAPAANASRELLTVKLRWKEPDADVSTPMEVPVVDEGMTYSAASADFKFAASVAAFGMCLRDSPNRGSANLDAVLELAAEGAANDPGGWRAEFVGLVKRAKELGAK
jgi:Ca-activated chloride channel family protein